MIKGLLATLALVAATVTSASAQWNPGQYNGQYGYGGNGGNQRQTQGIVASFNAFDLYLQTGGRSRYVHLHQGTVINPRGTTLRSGMPVRVLGYVDGGGTFQANEIDVQNNGNCGYQNNRGNNNSGANNGGYYGNGPYGSGHYNGNNAGCFGAHKKHHKHHDNDDNDHDNDDGGGHR